MIHLPVGMKKNWVLSQEAFDSLLDWLDTDREQAAMRYEDIRRRLIKIFTGRGCAEAEDLADEVINRVTTKLDELKKSFHGDPRRYFFGVGNKVFAEYLRKRLPDPPPVLTTDPYRLEIEYRCLERCTAVLSDENRRLLIGYFGGEEQSKAERRKTLAAEFGIALNALRIRAHRLRLSLQDCVAKCVDRSL
jgi:DNA-directed RNA polymerase specialized sigma24 family protein